jgi:hypothetical protein
MTTTVAAWVNTVELAARLAIHRKTLLRLSPFGPFPEGQHDRRGVLTDRAPLHWHPDATEAAFTHFQL